MNTTASIPPVSRPPVSNRRPLRQILCWTLTAFGVGIVAGSAYLLLGGDYFMDIPGWASIVFLPGFVAGYTVNGWGWSLQSCKVVGVLALGLTYAALAALARFAWSALKHRRQSAASRQDSR